MGMVPELPIAMLACARLGAPHTVVFGGFSAESLSGRLNDMGCEVLITQDEAWRKGSPVPLKENADDALADSPKITRAVVLRRTGNEVSMQEGRDLWWHELVADESDDAESCPCEPMESEDLLYLLYTSGTTAKPKGIVHTTAGYLVGVATTHHYIFDVKPDSVYWCAADVGWVTGHSVHRVRPVVQRHDRRHVRGCPRLPGSGSVVGDRGAVQGRHLVYGSDCDSQPYEVGARACGQARSVLDPPSGVGRRADQPGGVGLVPRGDRRDKVPVVDTWWQTETGMIMITPLPGCDHPEAGLGDQPFPGVDAAIYDEQGNEVAPGVAAIWCCGSRGRRCCAGSTVTTSGTGRRTGRSTRTRISPATVRVSTRTATSGCWVASTM